MFGPGKELYCYLLLFKKHSEKASNPDMLPVAQAFSLMGTVNIPPLKFTVKTITDPTDFTVKDSAFTKHL